MKTVIGIVAAVIAALLLSFLLAQRQDQRSGSDAVSPATGIEGGTAAGSDAAPSAAAGSVAPASGGIILSEPDRGLQGGYNSNIAPENEVEEPPRTVAGLPAIERSVELPVVDAETLPYERTIGHVDPPRDEPRPDSGFSPGSQLVVDNDGPLGGAQQQPDPTAPGPSGIAGASVDQMPSPADMEDPAGPGTPLDPSVTAGMEPMFQVPEEGAVEDPDGTPE